MPRPIKPNSQLPDSTRRLHEFLEERRIPRKKFAADIGITPSGVSSLFQNGREITRLQAAAIETRYGISEKWLLDGEGPKFRSLYENLSIAEQWLLEQGLPREDKLSYLTMIEIPMRLAELYFVEQSRKLQLVLNQKKEPNKTLIQSVVERPVSIKAELENALAEIQNELPVGINEKDSSNLHQEDQHKHLVRQWQTARYFFMDLTVEDEKFRPSTQAKVFEHDIDLDWINKRRGPIREQWKKLVSLVFEELRKPEDK